MVEPLPKTEPVSFAQRPVGDHRCAWLPEWRRFAVSEDELVGRPDGLAQKAFTVSNLRVDPGGGVEHGRRDQDLPHAARQLPETLPDSGVARLPWVRDVQQRDSVGRIPLRKDPLQPPLQGRIFLIQQHFPAEQPEPDICLPELSALGDRPDIADFPVHRQPVRFQPANPRPLEGIERVAGGRDGEDEQQRH
ncbi:MAG: hypothetical protein M9913_21785 [Bryobacteraceae bacterium]|nr:hypothetical protein [Solibacteraceae bacterium]MCL4841721.1 hypothetical protein [Bryobacteraceae bacterium]MCO5353472.1 hypothetical protein [Bryobacteraceae bacterium]